MSPVRNLLMTLIQTQDTASAPFSRYEITIIQ